MRLRATWTTALLILAAAGVCRADKIDELVEKIKVGLPAWNSGRATDENGDVTGEPLILARDRPGIEVRVEAYFALMEMGKKAKAAEPALLKVLADQTRKTEHGWVSATIAHIYGPDQWEKMGQMLQSTPGVLEQEGFAGDLDSYRLVADEKMLLTDDRVEALGRMAQLEMIPRRVALKISAMLNSKNQDTRLAAKRAMLRAPGDLQAKAFESAYWKVGSDEEDPLFGNIVDSQLVAEIAKKLESPSEKDRLRAALLLDFGETTNRPFSPIVTLARLASGDPSEAVRKAAEHAWRIGLMEDFLGEGAAPPYVGEISMRPVMPEYIAPLKLHLTDAKISDDFKGKAAALLLSAGELSASELPVLERSPLRAGAVRFVIHTKNPTVRARFFALMAATSGAQREQYIHDLKDPTDQQQEFFPQASGLGKAEAMFVFEILARDVTSPTHSLAQVIAGGLSDPDRDLRLAAAKASQRKWASTESIGAVVMPAVISRLSLERDVDVKVELVKALGILPMDFNGYRELMALSSDSEVRVRIAACESLRLQFLASMSPAAMRAVDRNSLRQMEEVAIRAAASLNADEERAGQQLWEVIHPGVKMPKSRSTFVMLVVVAIGGAVVLTGATVLIAMLARKKQPVQPL